MTSRPYPTESELLGSSFIGKEEQKSEPLCLLSFSDKGPMKESAGRQEDHSEQQEESQPYWGPDFFKYLATNPADKSGLLPADKTGRADDKPAPVKPGAPTDRAVDPKEAELLLADSIKDLHLTKDGSLPRLARFEPKVALKEATTVKKLAEEKLGPKASDAQIELFVREFGKENPDLDIESGDDEVEAGAEVTIPGQDRTGGIYVEENGRRSTNWANGSSREETADGILINAKSAGREIRFFLSEDGNPPSCKTVIKGKMVHQIRQDGTQIVSRLGDDDTAKVELITRPDKSHFAFSYNKDDTDPHTVTQRKRGSAPIIYKKNDQGEFVSKDGKKGLAIGEGSASVLPYDREVKDGSVTRTFEDKEQVKFDKEGKVTYTLSRPGDGLKVEHHFKPPAEEPDRVVIQHDELNKLLGRKGPLELTKTDAGRFIATVKGPDGRTKQGTVELSKDMTVSYRRTKPLADIEWTNPSAPPEIRKTVTTTETGDHDVRTDIEYGDGARVSRLNDRFGIKKSETYTDRSGAKWSRDFNSQGKPDSLKIVDGVQTVELKYDRSMQMLKGTVKEGGTTREATLCRDTLFIRGKDGKLEARSLDWDSDSRPKFQSGKFDIDKGTFTGETTVNGRKIQIRESIIPGIADKLRGGTIDGIMSNGVKASTNFMGEALVERPEGNAVKLGPDNLVDVWDETGADSVRGESLSRQAIDFLKKYPETDRRLIAEIHRRFRSDEDSRAKSDNMFKKLTEVDGIKGLSTEQKQALRHSVLNHVAFPEAITQGDPTFVCGGATMQRQLAINHPEKYASTLVAGLSGSPLKNIGGKDVKFDQANLLMHDTTGRDIASRVFQSMAMSLAHSKLKFENTSTGVGSLSDGEGNRRSFNGLGLDRMAMVLSNLTDSPKAVVMVNSESDLIKLFSDNKEKSMPLRCQPQGSALAHVYNLVGIEQGPPLKLRIQDHGGLTGDMSDAKTALKDLSEVFGDKGEATVVFGGKEPLDPKKIYKMEDGRIAVDEQGTKEFRERREREED